MNRKTLVAALLGLALASPAAAQIALPIHILPVMAKLSGAAGTDWMSSLALSNIGATPATVTALFFRENQNNIPLLGPSHQLLIGPGETASVDDVLGEWFPSQGSTKGFLVLYGEAEGSDVDPFLLTVAGRVFNNADPAATYGQTVPSGVLGVTVAPAVSNLPGARSDDAVRSNVGVVNLSLFPLDVIVSTYAADGTEVASVQRQVRSFSLSQWSLAQLGVAELSTPGRVAVRADPNSITWDPCLGAEPTLDNLQGIFITYLSRVDQVTGDAELVLGQSDLFDYIATIARAHRVP
jgi:hypothetical protein